MSADSDRQDEKLRSLLNASLLLNSTLSMGDVLHTLSLFATQHTEAERSTLYLLDPGTHELVSEIALGDDVEEVRLAPGEGIAGQVASTGELLNIPDAYEDERFDRSTDERTGFRTRNTLAVPIRDRKGAIMGVLQVLNKRGGEAFQEEDERYLETLAAHAAVGIQNARSFASVARERDALQDENTRLRRKGPPRVQPIGSSPLFLEALGLAQAVASSTANVLLRGESGSGKGIFARYIHQLSPRASGPLVQLNCSAIPADLIESELFGIEKGVATGVEARRGRLEMADGGSCFLDEIGDMSAPAQAKILRVIEDREVERVGGRRAIPLDVRIIAATHRDLGEAIAAKEFRADLYYRLNVVTIWLPPLRNRQQDVLELAQFFVRRFAHRNGRAGMRLSEEVLAMLQAYPWPGNVRELENVMERAVVLSRDACIDPSVLPVEVRQERAVGRLRLRAPTEPEPALVGAVEEDGAASVAPPSLRIALEEYEKALLRNALRSAQGVQTQAARELGISESNLRYKLKKHDLER